MKHFFNFHSIFTKLHKHDGDSYRLRHKLVNHPKEFSLDDARELSHKLTQLEQNYQQVCNALITAYPEMQRLHHENEFMLRLINEHAIGENGNVKSKEV